MHFISQPILSSAVISNMTPDCRLPITERTEVCHVSMWDMFRGDDG